MKNFPFPVFKTKQNGDGRIFDLNDSVERRKYFESKVGPEIEKLRDYLRENTFVGFLLGKKNSGKGTYAKMFGEIVGADRVRHISVGDIVRAVHEDFSDEAKKKELLNYLEKNYRGFMNLSDAVDALLGRSASKLLPTEFILALLKREIERVGKAAIFIDGFPRDLDQVSYSLYFRSLMGYRDDPDFFVFIDVPEAVIDERLKYRVICPICHTPRNMKVLRTKEVGYNEQTKEFYLKCDNHSCGGARMVPKEGDILGIEAVRDRMELDEKVMGMLLGLEGIPKVLLRNTVPISIVGENMDQYELTPSFRYEWDASQKKVNVIEEPWIIKNDEGELSYSLLPAPVVASFIAQTAKVLNL